MENKKEYRIILGSASPRRKELLEQIGVTFEVKVSGKEEVYHSTEAKEIVAELALMKAENVASEIPEEEKRSMIVIGSDTVVTMDGKILGKPADEADAKAMLTALQGRYHEVYTGIAVLCYDENGGCTTVNRASGTKVYVHEMSEEEILAYIATKEPMDKAGAYGIQGRFAAHIDKIDGDYYTVVGLPVAEVYQILKTFGAV